MLHVEGWACDGHVTAPHHARGDEGGGDARRVVPLLAEIWFTRRPPAMLAGGSSGFGPLALLYAARPSPSLPPRVVVVVKAGVGLGVGVSRGSRCGRGIGGGGDDDGWVSGCGWMGVRAWCRYPSPEGRRLGEWGGVSVWCGCIVSSSREQCPPTSTAKAPQHQRQCQCKCQGEMPGTTHGLLP